MTDREAMQQALEALENFARFQRMMMDGPDVSDKLLAEDYAEAGFLQGAKTITALRERLAQPEQEPVALPCCGYANASAVKWNPHNQVVQCHNCGQVYTATQPEPVIDKSAAIRIATALGWVPAGDTSQERVDEEAEQRQEPEPTVKWDASAPLVVTPHPAFQATLPRREWVGLTAAEFRKAVDGLEDLEDCWAALEHALKEKNT